MDEKAREEIRNARGNVRALSVILGLIAEKYDFYRGAQFIRECVELKQIDELREKEMRALSFLAAMLEGKLYAGLVELLADDLTDAEVLVVDRVPETAPEAEAKPAEEAKKTAKRTGSAFGRSTSASKRTGSAPKKATGKTKAGGAADGT